MLARRLCVYNASLKVDANREILTVVMISYYENVRSNKRHTVICRTRFVFGNSLCSFLSLRLATVSLVDDTRPAKKLDLVLISEMTAVSTR